MTDQTVEGYSNYATFGVAVTLDNDRDLAEEVAQNIALIRVQAPPSANVIQGIWTVEETIRFETADMLKEIASRLVEDGSPSLMAAQMAQAGLAEVNWEELADGYLAED